MWDRDTGQRRLTLRGTEHRIWSLAFSPDGTKLAVGGTNPQIEVRDTQTGKTLWAKQEPRLSQAMSVAFSPDGRSLAVGYGVYSGEGLHPVKLYEVATGRETDTFQAPKGGVNDLAFHRDGRRLAVAGSEVVEVWDIRAHTKVHELRGHSNWVYGVAFSPDGKWLATGGWDRTVKLWDTATGREVFTLRGHTAGVIALAFSPDGRRIVSGGLDRTARVWDATPLPAEFLQAQESRYLQKRTELKALRDNSEAEKSAGAGNSLSLTRWWDRSADDIGKVVESDPNSLPLRYLHVLTLLEARNRAGIRRACEDLLQQFGKTTDPAQANRVAWYCVLAPDAVADPKSPVRLADAALAGHPERGRPRSDVLKTLGAALYRAGRFEEAMRRLDESTQTRGDAGDPRGFAFLAMAHHRLGHHDEAKRWLDQLVAHRPKEGFDFSRDDVEIRILHREAETLILGSLRPAPLSAPSTPTKHDPVTGDLRR